MESSFIQKIWNNPVLRFCVGLVLLLSLVYLILVGLAVLGAGFRLIFTQPAIGMLEGVQENHILAFYLGDLSTALLQSSSVSHTVRLLSLKSAAGHHLVRCQRSGCTSCQSHGRLPCHHGGQRGDLPHQHCRQHDSLQREETAQTSLRRCHYARHLQHPHRLPGHGH